MELTALGEFFRETPDFIMGMVLALPVAMAFRCNDALPALISYVGNLKCIIQHNWSSVYNFGFWVSCKGLNVANK